MIGQNDKQGQNFTVSDAQTLVSFAGRNHLGRISMWSINRDSQCGSSFSETGMLSNTCSGTAQSGLQFSQIFGQLQGTAVITSGAGNVQPAVADTNPADAPYPLWSASASYPLGYKVVENGEIYQAKWYNSGDDPSAQVQSSWQTPWELLGPVVPGDRRGGHPHAAGGHLPGLVGRHPVPGRRQGAVPGTALPGQVVEPGRLPRYPVDRPVRLGVEGAVQRPRRAERRAGRGRGLRRLVPRRQPVPLAGVAVRAARTGKKHSSERLAAAPSRPPDLLPLPVSGEVVRASRRKSRPLGDRACG